MFTLPPTSLPAGPMLHLVLLLFISLAQCCCLETSTSSELLNPPFNLSSKVMALVLALSYSETKTH